MLELLIADQSVKGITIFVRNLLFLSNPKVNQVKVDFDKLEDYADYFRVDHVFCCLGTTIRTAGSKEAFTKVDLSYVIRSAEIAKRQGVESFSVVSAMGADSNSYFFYNRVKGKMEIELQKIGFSFLQIFRPSLLLGQRKEFRRGEKLGELFFELFSFAFVKGLKKYQPIHAKTVAQSMLFHAKTKQPGLKIVESNDMNY